MILQSFNNGFLPHLLPHGRRFQAAVVASKRRRKNKQIRVPQLNLTDLTDLTDLVLEGTSSYSDYGTVSPRYDMLSCYFARLPSDKHKGVYQTSEWFQLMLSRFLRYRCCFQCCRRHDHHSLAPSESGRAGRAWRGFDEGRAAAVCTRSFLVSTCQSIADPETRRTCHKTVKV